MLTESRTQKNNFYADILRDATDNVYGTTKNAVTSFEKRLKKKMRVRQSLAAYRVMINGQRPSF